VELFFHSRREIDVHYGREVLDEQISDQTSERRGLQAAALHIDVVAGLESRDRGRVSTRTPDPALLQRLDQTGFGEAGWRLGEVLVRSKRDEIERFAFLQRGQRLAVLVGGRRVLVFGLLIEREEAGEGGNRAGSPELILV